MSMLSSVGARVFTRMRQQEVEGFKRSGRCKRSWAACQLLIQASPGGRRGTAQMLQDLYAAADYAA